MKLFRIPSSVNKYLLTCFVFVMMFYGIHDSADWGNYLLMVKHPEICPDYLLRWFLTLCGKDTDFLIVNRLHFVLMGGAILLLIKRTVDCPIIAILYAVSAYLYLANQIRFYLGFPLMLLAIFSFYKKEYFIFAVLATVAILSHKSLILLLVVIPVDFVVRRMKFWKALLTLVILAGGVCFFSQFDFGRGWGLSQFHDYQIFHEGATFLGAVWNLIPNAICLTLIANVHSCVKREKPDILADLTYRYLLVVSLTPVLFCGAGFYLMVFTQRFVFSLVLIWMMYFYYCYTHYADKTLKEGIAIAFIVVFLANPFFACLYSLIKNNFYAGTEIFRLLMSYSIFS